MPAVARLSSRERAEEMIPGVARLGAVRVWTMFVLVSAGDWRQTVWHGSVCSVCWAPYRPGYGRYTPALPHGRRVISIHTLPSI